jgi:hypothetical protein
MRMRELFLLFGLVLCCMLLVPWACRREPRQTLPDRQKQNRETIQDGLQEVLVPTIAPDLQDWLGNDLLTLVSGSENITSYQIFPKKNDAPQNIAGYPIVQRGPDLTPAQRVRFQWLLLDESSYRPGSLKKCLFLPEYAFVLQHGENSLTVLVSTLCAQIQLLSGAKTSLRDCDPALPKIQELIETLFPTALVTPTVQTPQMQPVQEITPAVRALLNDPGLAVLTQPETVVPYQIFPKKQEAASLLQGYPIVRQGPDFTPEQVTTFQTIVLNEHNYRLESLKKCLFLPEYALVATRQETAVTLLLDFNCGQVKFLIGEQSILKDWDQGLTPMHDLVLNILATP